MSNVSFKLAKSGMQIEWKANHKFEVVLLFTDMGQSVLIR